MRGTVTNLSDALFWLSLAGAFALAFLGFLRSKKIATGLLSGAILLAAGAGYRALFQSTSGIQSKGDQPHQGAFLAALYVSMLLGMASNYLYGLLSTTKSARLPFDARNFFAPMIISPLVFIPLLGAFQNSYVDLADLTGPKLMIFIVSFENGFFWKHIYDSRQRGKRN